MLAGAWTLPVATLADQQEAAQQRADAAAAPTGGRVSARVRVRHLATPDKTPDLQVVITGERDGLHYRACVACSGSAVLCCGLPSRRPVSASRKQPFNAHLSTPPDNSVRTAIARSHARTFAGWEPAADSKLLLQICSGQELRTSLVELLIERLPHYDL